VVIIDHQHPHVQPVKGQGLIKNLCRNEKGERLRIRQRCLFFACQKRAGISARDLAHPQLRRSNQGASGDKLIAQPPRGTTPW
jgi:hypothetical protein